MRNEDPTIRRRAINHLLDSVRLGEAVGTCTMALRFAEALPDVHAPMLSRMTMLVAYEPFEPAIFLGWRNGVTTTREMSLAQHQAGCSLEFWRTMAPAHGLKVLAEPSRERRTNGKIWLAPVPRGIPVAISSMMRRATSFITLLALVPMAAAMAGGDFTVAQLQSVVLSGQHPVFGGGITTGERFGRACTGLGDVDADGVPDIAVGSRSDQDGGTDAGAVYVVLMNRDLSPKAAIKLGPGSGGVPTNWIASGDMFGYGVAGIGDLDGDGTPDLAITSPNAEPAGTPTTANRGALFICFLRPDGSARAVTRIDDTNGLPLANGDSCGQGCAHLGDLDGDGFTEVGLGAPGTDDQGFNRGVVHIVSLRPDGTMLRQTTLGQGVAPSLMLDDIDNFGGRGLARLGDLDGDGAIEVAVGCYRDDDGGVDAGAVWILSLRGIAGGAFVIERTAKISGTQGGLTTPLADDDLFGMTVAPLGDLNQDGIADIAIGNNKDDIGATDIGAVVLAGLSSAGAVNTERVIAQGSGFPGLTLIPGERFGRALANLGDLRGDGSVVLGVGAGAGVNGGRLWMIVIGAQRSPDLNHDGTVDGADLSLLLAAWSLSGPTDLDWSGSTTGADLSALLGAW